MKKQYDEQVPKSACPSSSQPPTYCEIAVPLTLCSNLVLIVYLQAHICKQRSPALTGYELRTWVDRACCFVTLGVSALSMRSFHPVDIPFQKFL